MQRTTPPDYRLSRCVPSRYTPRPSPIAGEGRDQVEDLSELTGQTDQIHFGYSPAVRRHYTTSLGFNCNFKARSGESAFKLIRHRHTY